MNQELYSQKRENQKGSVNLLQPRITKSNSTERKINFPSNLGNRNSKVFLSVPYAIYSNIDIFWMMAGKLFSKTQTWASWNAQRYKDPIRKNVVCSMQNIMLPPTGEDLVKQTLKRSQIVEKKCVDKYAVATYNLAAAKIERQIQIQNSPELDDCLIDLDQIHTT